MKKPWSAVFSAVLALFGAAASFGADVGAPAVTLPGHVPPQIRGATRLGRVSPDENVSLTLTVRVDPDLMSKTLAGLYGPGAPARKHFLSNAEFAQKFDLASKRRKLKEFAAASGLIVAADDNPGSLAVRVSGPAERVEKAFNVQLNKYRSVDGQVFRAHETNPSIPAGLAAHLGAVLGLSNYRGARKPHIARSHLRAAAVPRAARASAPGAKTPSALTGESGPFCYDGTDICGLAPNDIKVIYGLNGTTLTGSGQKIALLELDGYASSDIGLYETNTFLYPQPGPSPTVNYVGVDGQGNFCGPGNDSGVRSDPCDADTLNGAQSDEGGNGDGGMVEVALDIENLIALAPSAEIYVYTAANTDANSFDAYALIASQVDSTPGSGTLAPVASTSWGADEEDADSMGAVMAQESEVFQQMAAQGQALFAAAGDAGAFDASSVTVNNAGVTLVAWAGTPITDDPASQPYVTAVGGTSLSGTVSSHSEIVWNEGCASNSDPAINCRLNGAGGGGIADYCENGSGDPVSCNAAGATPYWPIPFYQAGVSGMYSQTYRNVPDVTLNADPYTSPYTVCVGGDCSQLIGGTSAAAPLWAAFTALLNQKRASGGYELLGFANPTIYQLAQGSSYATTFNDITNGSNGSVYSAKAGYDNVSGWGSFKGSALINALQTPLASTQAVTGMTALTLGVSSITYSWTPVAGLSYEVYNALNTAQRLNTGIQPPFVQTGLTADQTAGIEVFVETDGVLGTNPASITTATYAAAPAGAPTAVAVSSIVTLSYAACSPSSSCSGYLVQVSTNSNFSGTLFSSSTPSSAQTSLIVSGLTANTEYSARLATLNKFGAPSLGASAPTSFYTGTNLVAPISLAFPLVSTGVIVFAWAQGLNPSGISYYAQASPSPSFTGTVFMSTVTVSSAAFGGLTGDTSYYFQVQGVGEADGPPANIGPQATLAAAPIALANAFSSVGTASLTLSWSGANDEPDTLYQTDVSPSATFASGLITRQARSPTAAFTGLTANTLYYARVAAIGRAGGATAEVPLGSTTTIVAAPTLPLQPFSGQTSSGFAFTFNQPGGNPVGTGYLVQIATSSNFTTVVASATTTSASASFTGLFSDQLYYAEVASYNQFGSLSAFAGGEGGPSASTATAVLAPLPAAVPVTTETAAAIGFAWAPGTLSPYANYLAQASVSPTFVPVASSSATANLFATIGGLQANTTYYGQVQAVSPNPPTPSGSFLLAASAATLANPPSAAPAPFLQVAYTSASVAWTSLPLTPQISASEGYLVQFDTVPDFSSGVVLTSAAAPGAATAVVSDLNYAALYYARVGSLNWEGLPNFLSLGSTMTLQPSFSSGTIGLSGIALTVPQSFPQISSISVIVPSAAFPPGTPISATANFAALPPPLTNEASSIVPFGSNVGIILTANGLQPNSPVTITMAYDFTQIPPGLSESRLQLWRFDPTSDQWTLVPSQVDTVGHVLTAQTQHFSTFSPFFVAAGADVNSVQVWPQPWEIGDATSQYWASVLSFSNLPAGATVKIFTVVGELVWDGTAAADGTLTWNGNNRFGRHVASGTYYAAFKNGSQTKTRRLVIIR